MKCKMMRLSVIIALLLTTLPSMANAQEPTWRDLKRDTPQGNVEHVIIFVAGWQLLDACLLFGDIPGLNCSAEQFNPVWTWEVFKDSFKAAQIPGILHNHSIKYPSYPANTTSAEGQDISKVVYYSYTGNYSYIRDTDDDSSVEKKGACEPQQQLDPPLTIDGERGYLCLPDYSRADTSVFLQRVNGRTLWEGLSANFIDSFTDPANLEKWAELIWKEFKTSPLNPDFDSVKEEFIRIVAQDVVDRTLKEYGIYEISDVSPQRALFNKRAEQLQELINGVTKRFHEGGKEVEITIVGHSQGGLISTYWAGWEGNDSIEKNPDNINAIVTLDSPLGRKISGSGLAKTIFKDTPNVSLVVDLPSVSLPYFGEIFPGQRLELVEFPLGYYLRAALSRLQFKIFWGLDDIVDQAATRIPIVTIRNNYDLFVTYDNARLDGTWHDKTVYYDSERSGANHSQVTKEKEVSYDIQYVAVSGSIYSPNRDSRFTYYVDSTQNQRMQIQMAAPAFKGGVQPTPDHFTVEAVQRSQNRIAYNLNVVSVVQNLAWSPQTNSPNMMAPPLELGVSLPEHMQSGIYDLHVSYSQLGTPSEAIAYEAINVVSGASFADTSLVVVVDRSGSMGEQLQSGTIKINAVRNAASFLAQIASTDPQNRLGVMGFNANASKVYPGSGPIIEVTTGNLTAYLTAISGLSPNDGTQVTNALLAARQWLQEGNTASRRKAIIVLTDGDSSDKWITSQHAQQFVGVPVYTIGFGDNTTSFNEAELKLIAKDTGGAYYYAPNEAQLRAIYDEIQRQVTGANGIVQLDKPLYPNQVETIEFQVDPTLQQFRLAANWDSTQIGNVKLKLLMPNGVELDENNVASMLANSSILSSNGSWIFSTRSPQPGTWKLVVTGASFAGATGALRLTSSVNTTVQLEVALSPGPGITGDPLSTLISLVNLDPAWSISSIINAQATAVLPSGRRVPIDLYDDGYHSDGSANDLLFAAVVPGHLTTQVGSYILEIIVNGLLGTGSFVGTAGSTDSATTPFNRIFTVARQVEMPTNTAQTANLASMVVRKPNSATEYCISYANYGPGIAKNVQMLVSANNAIYATSDVAATRHLVDGFAFGWNLGQVEPDTSNTIATTIIPLQENEPVELATWIGSTVPENGSLADIDIDPIGADTINVAIDAGKTHQIDAGWTLFGLNGIQPTVALPTSILCAIDGPVDLVLGYEKGGVTYDPSVPDHINTLRELDALHGYWIKSEAARTLAVNGTEVAVDTPIELHQGWNVVNYLPTTTQLVTDALSSIKGDYTAVLGYEQGATSFYTTIPPQLSTLQSMEPQHAYWIHMQRPNTLVYHALPDNPAESAALRQVNQPQRPVGVIVTNRWMNFFSRSVYINHQLAPVGTTIEAYTRSGLKVGSAQIVEPGMMQLLTVYGDDLTTANVDGAQAGESIEFRANGEHLITLGNSVNWTTYGALHEISLTDSVNKVYLPVVAR